MLSRSGATSHDVIQGSLGDCWLLGALSLVATRPDKIVEVIPFFAIDQGVFVVRFYRNRTRIDVVVDDLLPCLSSGEPVFAHNRGFNEFWVSIVEKAMAKISGSYYGVCHFLSLSLSLSLFSQQGPQRSSLETRATHWWTSREACLSR